MPTAPTAVLSKLNPIGIVPLRLLGLIVAPLALLAREGDGDSDVSASHGSFGKVEAGVHTTTPPASEVRGSV
jgi:hypothetical protein